MPLVAYGPGARAGVSLGTRATQSDLGQTVAENFGGTIPHGTSFLSDLVVR